MEVSAFWEIIQKVGVFDALTEQGAWALWEAASELKPGSHIVEIGCHFGRSSTLFMLLAKEHGHALTFIDPWAGEPFQDQRDADRTAVEWLKWIRSFRYPFTLHCCRTEDLAEIHTPTNIDFLYVDGDHTRRAVEIDSHLIMEVNRGGIVAFDNYGTHPGVAEVVDPLLADGALRKRCLAGIMMVTEKV